jgi:hypothetical protein
MFQGSTLSPVLGERSIREFKMAPNANQQWSLTAFAGMMVTVTCISTNHYKIHSTASQYAFYRVRQASFLSDMIYSVQKRKLACRTLYKNYTEFFFYHLTLLDSSFQFQNCAQIILTYHVLQAFPQIQRHERMSSHPFGCMLEFLPFNCTRH